MPKGAIKKDWVIAGDKKPSFSLEGKSATFLKILLNRGIQTKKEAEDFLDPKYDNLSQPERLRENEKAAGIILEARKNQEKVVIFGDYDVDGVCATALLLRFFTEIGVICDYYIPDREKEGYGPNKTAIDKIVKGGAKVLLTVDCGIVAFEPLDYARSLGLKVIVTDHHLPRVEKKKILLPSAEAIIDPKLQSEEEPFYYLCGAGVAFYLVRMMIALDSTLLHSGQEKWLLDLVAIATICDVVPLRKDNRILAKFGLIVVGKSRNRGLKALAKIAGLNLKEIDSYKIAFVLGPRLNAAGRLEDAKAALNLLVSEDQDEAKRLADNLSRINEKRQELTERIVKEAKELIDKKDSASKLYFLASRDWPAGVVGIAASRLVEQYHRPVLIMEDDGESCQGSGRSIDGFDLVEALSRCGKYLTKFGGHKKAAGFSFETKHFLIIDKKLIQISEQKIKAQDLLPKIFIDENITNKNIIQKLADEISLLEPFGAENPKPVFALKKVKVIEARTVGNPAIHSKLTLQDDCQKYQAIYFNYQLDQNISEIDLVFTVEKTIWNGQKKIDLKVIDINT